MSVADSMLTYVPYLRRFARALTGSQATGDATAVAALEAIVAGKGKNLPARIALYRALVEEVNSIGPALPAAPGDGLPPQLEAAQRNLDVLTPLGRQAFLLVAMEEFSIQDAARVLNVTPDVVDSLLNDASQDITAQLATDVVIIEDEPLIAMDLQLLVKSLGHRVVRIARTERQAVEAVRQTQPGLVLADIQLADGGSGLDAVNEILRTFSMPVIFVTAYPEKLLTGAKPEPTYVIPKPYKPETVKAVISQALFFHSSRRT